MTKADLNCFQDAYNLGIIYDLAITADTVAATSILKSLPYELVGRKKAMSAISKLDDITEIKNQNLFSRFDFEVISGETPVIFEAKDRDCYSNIWGDDILNEKKYDDIRRLRLQADMPYSKAYIIMTFSDKKAYIYDLDTLKITRRGKQKVKNPIKGQGLYEDVVYFDKKSAKYVVDYE